MLIDLLDSKKCFKLVCGAGNEDLQEVERLVYVYAKAGCSFFDISANKNVISAAKYGYSLAQTGMEPYFCVSFGIKGDPHICKASINIDNCRNCNTCEKVCPQNAIQNLVVKKERCIGCLKCLKECSFGAIDLSYEDVRPETVLQSLNINDLSCIELHSNSCEEDDLFDKWNDINKKFKGILSICIDRSNLGNKQLLARIKKMTENRAPYTTIIQADGIPMSGSKDDYKTTLQAVAIAEIVQDAKLPVYLMLSGGTNCKTTQLAKMCGIEANGVAIGSFARKIVKEYIKCDNFYSNISLQSKAVLTAQELIYTSLEYLG